MSGGVRIPTMVKHMTIDLLARSGAKIMTNSRVKAIAADTVQIIHKDQSEDQVAVDSVVLAMGMTSNCLLADQISGEVNKIYRIGDCREPRNVMNAVWDAYEIARYI